MNKPKVVTFLPAPLDFQLSHIFSNRLNPSIIDLVQVTRDSSEDEACQTVVGASVILLPPIRHINRKILKAAKGVKLIQVISVGYDFIDIEAATELQIPVANNPGCARARR